MAASSSTNREAGQQGPGRRSSSERMQGQRGARRLVCSARRKESHPKFGSGEGPGWARPGSTPPYCPSGSALLGAGPDGGDEGDNINRV
jgi:hypothetical protein